MSDIQRMATELFGEEDAWFVVPEKKGSSTPPSSITGKQAQKAKRRRKMEKASKRKNR